MIIKLKPTKQLFFNESNGYRVLSCVPIVEFGDEPSIVYPELELNAYGNFTLNGSNISNLQLHEEYELEILEDRKSKYPASYVMIKWANIEVGEEIKIAPDQEVKFLSQFMEPSMAKNVNNAYPDFVQRVLNGEENTLDYKTIYGVGPVRFESYVDKIKLHCGSLRYFPICSEWNIIDDDKIQKLASIYETPEELKEALNTSPYHVFFHDLEYSFNKADKAVLEVRPTLKKSKERCELGCMEILKQNEFEGDTRIDTDLMTEMIEELMPECIDKVEDVLKNSELIYYDEVNEYCSFQSTYEAEQLIANELLTRVKSSENKGMDWEQFRNVDGFECTNEQVEILKLANEHRVAMLRGGAGCVDADTEFFDGRGWKRIADYQEGDKVLQYNKDGTAELVTPWRYIKEPCDKMYHFETKYGLDMTLSPEHNVCTISQKGKWHEQTMEEVYQKQMSTGFYDKFITTFNYSGKGIDLTDAEIKLMCAIICDGSFYAKYPNNFTCRFRIKKQRKKDALRLLFKENNKEWREHESVTEGYTDFYIEAPRREKEFTDYWYDCTQHQLQIICDNIMQWDGSVNQTKAGVVRKRFSANNLSTATFIQFAYTACGYKATIVTNDRRGRKKYSNVTNKTYIDKTVEYAVIISERTMCTMTHDNRPNHKNTVIEAVVPIDGFKYCFTVPSHYLVLRRNKHIFITGNCGKSSAMKALVLMLEHYGQSYIQLAPTGKAANRLRETTGRPASTIHMHLACGGITNVDYVLIDECSMVGVHLLANLMSTMHNDTRIVFICDEAQLASISCGNVVQDIIESGVVPTATLTKVFRYGSSGLATIATDTRNGKLSVRNTSNEFDDYKFYNAEEDAVNQIVDIYSDLLGSGYDKDEILILSPFNKGKQGTYAINKAIQDKFNKNKGKSISYEIKGQATITFKVGDKVINTKNNYNIHLVEYDEDGTTVTTAKTFFVANGDIGYVRSIKENDGKSELIVQFGDRMASISGQDIAHLLLGYAITIHKAQGSESKAVILYTNKAHKRMLTKNLLYVGGSRARELLIEIGDIQTIEDGLKIAENKTRDTWLKEMLVNG